MEYTEKTLVRKKDKKTGKWGMIDISNGKMILPCEYNNICTIGNEANFIYLEKDGKWGAVDLHGKIILPFEYEDIFSYDKLSDLNFLCIEKDEKRGIIDLNGKIVLPIEYDDIDIHLHHTGLFWQVWKNGKWGIMEENGQTILPCQYDKILVYCGEEEEVVLSLKKDNKWSIINLNLTD